MSKHTPGPWEVIPGNEYQSGTGYSVVAEIGGGYEEEPAWIVQEPTQNLTWQEEEQKQYRNARLIHAAPNLLEACHIALEWIRETLDDVEAEHIFNELPPQALSLYELNNVLVDAIAKTQPPQEE